MNLSLQFIECQNSYKVYWETKHFYYPNSKFNLWVPDKNMKAETE